MMPVPKRNWKIRVRIVEDPGAQGVEGTIQLNVVLPTINDFVQITDFRRLLRGEYHDVYRVAEVGLGSGDERMLITMTRVRKDVEPDQKYTSKPAVYSLGSGKYLVDLGLLPGGQIAQRRKIPAIPLMGDFFKCDEDTQFVSLDDPGFGSGDPQFPVVMKPETLLRVIGAFHSWTWLRPGVLRDGTPRLDVTPTNLSTRRQPAAV